jgi:hypothetical protein
MTIKKIDYNRKYRVGEVLRGVVEINMLHNIAAYSFNVIPLMQYHTYKSTITRLQE